MWQLPSSRVRRWSAWISGWRLFLLSMVFLLLSLQACSSLSVRHARSERAYLGAELYRESLGDQGDFIVFLPGLMGSTAFWRSGDTGRLTTAGHRLLFVDLLGFGRSPWPRSQYNLDDHIGALRRTMEEEGATRHVTLVGHSFGAIVAAHYAAQFPDEVHQLILFGPPIYESRKDAGGRIGAMSPLAALLMRSPLAARAVCALHNAFMPLASSLAPRIRPELPSGIARDGALHFWPSLYGSVSHVILDEPIQGPLRTVGKRTVLVLGDEDGISDAALVAGIASETGASMVHTKGDHSSYWRTYPDVLLQFLDAPEHEAGAPSPTD